MAYKGSIAVAYGLALAILLAVGVVSYRDVRLEQQSQQWVVHTYDVLRGIDNLDEQLIAAEDDRRGFVLSGDPEYSKSFAAACAEARLQASNLRGLTADNPREQERLDRLHPALDGYLALLTERLTKSASPNLRLSHANPAGDSLVVPTEIQEIIAGMQNEEKGLLAERTERAKNSSRLARWFTAFGFALSASLILAALFLIRREMAHREIAQHALEDAHAQLERRVEERTHDLAAANQELRRSQDEIQALNTSLEQRVNDRTAELLRANKELETFSYSVAHDLRAPLRHIDGFARILQDEHAAELSEEGRGYVARILQAVTRMGRLVDDMLNLARIGRQELVRERANLDSLVRQSLADLPHETEGRRIEWRVEPLPEVECDPGLLKLVLSNLLANAAKFTRSRPLAVIEIGTLQENGSATFFVRDNGVGFDPKYADKLFGVFQRLHRQEDFEGTGVGLATVQRIIHRHGGKIWAEAQLDRGATFFFTLESKQKELAPQSAQEVTCG